MESILYYGKKYGKKIAICFLVFVITSVFVYQGFIQAEADSTEFQEVAITDLVDDKKEKSEKEESKEEKKEETKKATTKKIHVDVKGAVKKPGVYEVDFGSIIIDLVKLAGGFQNNASSDSINLSKKVIDEMVLYVYTKDEIKEYQDEKKAQEVVETISPEETEKIEENSSLTESKNEPCKTPDYVICDCTDKKESVIVPEENTVIPEETNLEPVKTDEQEPTNENNGLVNINTASLEELVNIKGIGDAKARAIIKYREENGAFMRPEDLMNVSGIGEKLFEKIRDYITV